MKKLAFLSLVVFAVSLSSCGPVYQTKRTVVSPKDKAGRECANKCIERKDKCINECQKIAANVDIISNITSKFSKSDSNGGSDKMSDCAQRCEESYEQCHKNCGGKILEEEVCIANCDKEGK